MGEGAPVTKTPLTPNEIKTVYKNHYREKEEKYNNLAKGLMGVSAVAVIGGLAAAIAAPATGIALAGWGVALGVGGASQVAAGLSKVASLWHRGTSAHAGLKSTKAQTSKLLKQKVLSKMD